MLSKISALVQIASQLAGKDEEQWSI